MRNIFPAFQFVRGTTPKLVFALPEEIDPTQYKVYVTFVQNFKSVLTVISGSDQMEITGTQVTVSLSQSDTLLLAVGDVDVIIDYASNDQEFRNTSEPIYGLVQRGANGRVIPEVIPK